MITEVAGVLHQHPRPTCPLKFEEPLKRDARANKDSHVPSAEPPQEEHTKAGESRALTVERRGRKKQTETAVGVSIVITYVAIALNASARWRSGRLPGVEVVVLALVWFLFAALSLIRRLALAIFDQSPPTLPKEKQNAGPGPSDGGTVICCSGGGIKSASFCLGVLQRLGQRDTYKNASTLVGVSGGGYAAAAYAIAHQKAVAHQTEPPFALNSAALATLRRRTNYLASSARVRFDFLSSLLGGLVFNLLVFTALGAVIAWLLSGFAQAMHFRSQYAYSKFWTYDDSFGWLVALVPAVPPLAFSLGMFLLDRAKSDDPDWHTRWSSRGKRNWASNLPNYLGTASLLWLVFVPGVLWLSFTLHNLWLNHGPLLLAAAVQVQALLGLVGASTFVALTRSAVKGVRADRNPNTESDWGNAVATFRTAVAPRLAVGLALIVAAVLTAAGTAYELTDNGSSNLAGQCGLHG